MVARMVAFKSGILIDREPLFFQKKKKGRGFVITHELVLCEVDDVVFPAPSSFFSREVGGDAMKGILSRDK